MNEKSINEQYKSVISLLEQKRLKEAQMQLKSMLGETGNWPLCDRLEKDYNALQGQTEKEALALAGADGKNEDAACDYLTDYTNRVASGMLYEWMELGKRLMVKYIDGTVRPERDGQFVRTPGGLGVPVERPGYPERYRREIVKATGSRFEVK